MHIPHLAVCIKAEWAEVEWGVGVGKGGGAVVDYFGTSVAVLEHECLSHEFKLRISLVLLHTEHCERKLF